MKRAPSPLRVCQRIPISHFLFPLQPLSVLSSICNEERKLELVSDQQHVRGWLCPRGLHWRAVPTRWVGESHKLHPQALTLNIVVGVRGGWGGSCASVQLKVDFSPAACHRWTSVSLAAACYWRTKSVLPSLFQRASSPRLVLLQSGDGSARVPRPRCTLFPSSAPAPASRACQLPIDCHRLPLFALQSLPS